MANPSTSKYATARLPAVPGLRAIDVHNLLAPQGAQAHTAAGSSFRGQHVALIAASSDDPSAEVFERAALALGAHVARIAPETLSMNDPIDAANTALMLGRLYAAIGCAGVDAWSLSLLKRVCGVPVLHDMGTDTHASRLLGDLMTLKQTMFEAGAASSRPPRLGICGPARSGLLRAWKRMAAAAGIDVIDLSGSQADGDGKVCDFVCRPACPPELLAFPTGPAVMREISLAERQRGNHGRVVQTVLGNVIAARH